MADHHGNKTDYESEDELHNLTDPTEICRTTPEHDIGHNIDHFLSLKSKLPKFIRSEKNFTEDFFNSLKIVVPNNKVRMINVHIYGGPECGKSTLARAIGYNIKEFYGDDCQCIECSYLPDAIPHIDYTKKVIVISVDDPMGAAEEGGTQDARRGMNEDVNIARSTFNAIRHLYAKKVILKRAEDYFGTPLPDQIIRLIEKYHDNRDKLAEHVPKAIATVSGILFMMWGPQLPTIDQTFHQNKLWNIYKGFSAMDDKRKSTLRSHLGTFWMKKLGEKEMAWRINKRTNEQSWSILESPYTGDKGWLYVEPAPINIFEKVDRGGKGFEEKIKMNTERTDEWAKYIYENKTSLRPPYDPFDKKENRLRSIKNFIKDIITKNKDPRTFDELQPHNQLFLKEIMKNNINALDDRIIRYHHTKLDERTQIEHIAQQLVQILENNNMTPHMRAGRSITHDLARSEIPAYRQFIEKPKNFTKIFDHLLHLWYLVHPEDYKRGAQAGKKIPEGSTEELIEQATVETPEGATEFSITEEQIIQEILDKDPKNRNRALLYMYSEGIGGRDILTNRQIHLISQDPAQRKKFEFTEAFTSIDAVKYHKQQFRGLMSYALGKLFEDWLEHILREGYYIPNVLENIKNIQHSDYEGKSQPDFVLEHDSGSYSIMAAKCYSSTRSETLEKEEIFPELRYYNTLRERGKKARIVVIYCNIQIPHMLDVQTYSTPSDVPANLTFSPSAANKYYFVKGGN